MAKNNHKKQHRMKKSEILALDWRRTKEIAKLSPSVTIRELSAEARKTIIDESTAMREEKNSTEANEYFVQEFCFQSVIDEDGEVVFNSPENREHALSALPRSWFEAVFSAVAEMNDLLPAQNAEAAKEAIEKKSLPDTAECQQPNSDGITDSAGNSDS